MELPDLSEIERSDRFVSLYGILDAHFFDPHLSEIVLKDLRKALFRWFLRPECEIPQASAVPTDASARDLSSA
jgi:hypothetical protein